jgi:glycosyltransferase involved in cell wall biosynthesis
MSVSRTPRYLQVTHIPFTRDDRGRVLLDEVWANDLLSQVKQLGPMRVVAPEVGRDHKGLAWGPSVTTLSDSSGLVFRGFPPRSSPRDLLPLRAIRNVLREEVDAADVIHTSNLFPPYLPLAYAHERAVRKGKLTVFVVAEDFYDMLSWEWVRVGASGFERTTRRLTLEGIEGLVRHMVRTASLVFFHTPTTVTRYRLETKNGVAIRLPTHEAEDVISESEFERKRQAQLRKDPLAVGVLARHNPIKGIDFFIRSVAALRARGIRVKAKVYGFGQLTENYKALAACILPPDAIEFLGPVSPGRPLFRAMAELDVFVMPHRTNDFGRTFYDAMAGGTPVVAFDTPASKETVYAGTDGLLVPMDNVIALSQAIERLDKNRDQLVSMAAAARARGLVDTKAAWQTFRAMKVRELLT